MAVRNAKEAKRQAQQEWRRKDLEVFKIEQVNVRVPIKYKENLKRFGALLRERGNPWEAFQIAFPRSQAALLQGAKERERERHPDTVKKKEPAASPPRPAPIALGKPKSNPKGRAPPADRRAPRRPSAT